MEPIVATSQGKVRGVVDEHATVFLGIPYAASPIGEHRFGPPIAPPAWNGTRDALAYGATALQPAQEFTLIPEPIVAGDNCLNLNVFTPDPGAAGLPVLVWIHGGGFFAGCNASPWYRGLRFARDGVVLVSINYRLGIEGFALVDDGAPNRGVLDMIAALAWVHDNIAAFGGDPARVTIGGQSAGAMACATLLTVPRARGLFRGAVLMSGAAQACVPLAEATATARRLAEHLGVDLTRRALTAVPPDRLLEAQAAFGPGGTSGTPDLSALARPLGSAMLPFAPVVDGDLLPAMPLDAVRAGVGSDISVLVGTTAQEMNMAFQMGGTPIDDASVGHGLASLGFSDEQADAYRRAHRDDPPAAVLGQALTDSVFRIPAVRFAEARAGATAGTYSYEFRWRSPAWDGALGACHCLDIPFAFDNLDAERVDTVAGADPPRALADAMHRAWVRFITDGDPGWDRYDAQRRTTMIFDTDSRPLDDPLRFERTLWADVP